MSVYAYDPLESGTEVIWIFQFFSFSNIFQEYGKTQCWVKVYDQKQPPEVF